MTLIDFGSLGTQSRWALSCLGTQSKHCYNAYSKQSLKYKAWSAMHIIEYMGQFIESNAYNAMD